MNESKHAPKKPKDLDLRYASKDVQKYVRERAIAMYRDGESAVAISRRFNAHVNTVRKWIKRFEEEGLDSAIEGKKRGPREKTRALLTNEQKKDLFDKILDKKPLDYGIDHSLWHSSTVRLLIQKLYGVHVAKSTICQWFNKMGWSYQRPVKRAVQRDQAKVDEWLNVTYPYIVKQAKEESAIVLWQDETSLCQDPNWVKGWSKKGKTPILEINPRARYGNAVMLVAINNLGKLLFSIQSQAVTGEDFKLFLSGLRKEYGPGKKLIVICDNASIHKAKNVKDWLCEDGKMELKFLPAYSPDLNPVEVFNQVLKIKMRMAPSMNKEQTQKFAEDEANAMKQNQGEGVRKCFLKESVSYASFKASQKYITKK